MEEIKNILVPIDGSKNSFKALTKAIYLAKKCDASITALYVLRVAYDNPDLVYVPQTQNELKKVEKFLSTAKNQVTKDSVSSCRIHFWNSKYIVIFLMLCQHFQQTKRIFLFDMSYQNLKIDHTKSLIRSIAKYETPALAGIVIIQAQTILLPIPHLTAEIRLTAPAPIIEPEIA